MKTSITKFVALCAICASFACLSASASAGQMDNRAIRAQIASLKMSKNQALAYHHKRKARAIQAQINALRAQLHRHRH